MTFDPSLNFTTKQQYLVWRLRWKEEYYSLVKSAQEAKVAVKEAHRALSKDRRVISQVWEAISDRRSTVQDIDKHLHVLWRAKEEAARQVAAKRNTPD